MTSRTIVSPKTAAETIPVPFDFSSQLASGETISTATVTAAVWSGVDASPSAIISGAATIAGAITTQAITAGVVGVMYYLNCAITTSAGQTLNKTAFLAVTYPAP